MSTQFFWSSTRLVPPRNVGGVDYALALVMTDQSSPRIPDTEEITSGVIHSVVDLGGGRKKIVFSRSMQSYHDTISYGAGDTQEITKQASMGGNVVVYHEAQTLKAYNNANTRTGLNWGSRATVGDCVEEVAGQKRRRYTIEEARAFGEPPASVNFAGDAFAATMSDFAPAVVVAQIGVDLTASPPVSDLEGEEWIFEVGTDTVAWIDTDAPDAGSMTIRSFGADDDDYPSDASFDATAPEYHIDTLTGVLHFGTGGIAAKGIDQILVNYRERSRTSSSKLTPSSTLGNIQLDADSAGAGYAGAADDFLAAYLRQDGDFDITLNIQEGAGSVEVRSQLQRDAAVAAMPWSTSGLIGTLRERDDDGDSIANASTTGGSYSLPFQVRIQRSGQDVTFSHRQASADSWVAESAITLTPDGTQYLGVATASGSTVRWQDNLAAGWSIQHLPREGNLTVDKTKTYSNVNWFASFTLGSSEPIDSVTNLTTGEPGSPFTSGTRDRTHYLVGGGSIAFYTESFGDAWRVVHEQPSGVPSGPGEAPRVFNQVNWATDGGSGTASTNVNENRANWRDYVIVSDPNNQLLGTPGSTVSIKRNPAFGDLVVYYDVRNRSSTDWRVVPTNSYLTYPADGVIIFRSDWIDSLALSAADGLCFRVVGDHYQQEGGPRAKHHNELATVVDNLDKARIEAGTMGTANDVSGGTSNLAVGYTGFIDNAGAWYPFGAVWGMPKNAFLSINTDQADASWHQSQAWPFWDTSLNKPFLSDARGRRTNITGTRPTDNSAGQDEWDQYVDEYFVDYFPNDGGVVSPFPVLGEFAEAIGFEDWEIVGGVRQGTPTPSATNLFGWVGFNDGNVGGLYNYTAPALSSGFKFQGIPFSPNAILQRIPGGSTIIEATLRCRFNGLRSVSMSAVHTSGYVYTQGGGRVAGSGQSWKTTYAIQGVTIKEVGEDGTGASFATGPSTDLSQPLPEPSRTVAMSWSLMGRRKNSELITLKGGSVGNIDDSKLVAIGGGSVTTDTKEGAWQLVDCTGAMQALIDDRHSVYTEYQLWPSRGETFTASDAIERYVTSLLGSRSASVDVKSGGAPYTWSLDWSASGKYTWWESLELGSIVLGYRLPSGLVDQIELPIGTDFRGL